MVVLAFCRNLLRWLGMLGLAFVILWHVSQNTGETDGRVIVHVTETDVSIRIDDDLERSINSTEQIPTVFAIPPGRHQIRLFRGESMEDDQQFEVGAGEEVMLTLWNGNRDQKRLQAAVLQAAMSNPRTGLSEMSNEPRMVLNRRTGLWERAHPVKPLDPAIRTVEASASTRAFRTGSAQ
jgi:hypothetical protein